MCTAITFESADHYFGRNLDLEYSYGESITVTPRGYPFPFRCADAMDKHYGMIGMALIEQGYPLYFDATNEYGLSMAGLNFPGNACYHPRKDGADNITPFELIPWILGQCQNVAESIEILNRINLLDEPFSQAYPLTPLHWIIADREQSVTVEPLEDGIKIYDNPVGVLTNNPAFDYHLHNLQNYLNLTPRVPDNRFSKELHLTPYSNGMGAIGLPGDLSSPSRFVRAAFVKCNSRRSADELKSVSQFFHILGAVAQQEGCNVTAHGLEKTIYSSCCNTDKLIYYYTTYENQQITAVRLQPEQLHAAKLISYPLVTEQQIRWSN